MSRIQNDSLAFERAMRMAAIGHRDQVRKGTGVPYIEHPMAVALILDRAGFEEDVVIAGLLHDLVEDTHITLEQIGQEFGDPVAVMVASCSEFKHDAEGKKRPWIDRKRDHIAAVALEIDVVLAIVLADKLHNLVSIHLDLLEGRDVWGSFNADRDQVLWYYKAMIDACQSTDPRLKHLANDCRALLAEVATLDTGKTKKATETG